MYNNVIEYLSVNTLKSSNLPEHNSEYLLSFVLSTNWPLVESTEEKSLRLALHVINETG
jgi:hypothetical protein